MLMNSNVQTFLKCVMNNDFQNVESNSISKYYNTQFDLILMKSRDGKKIDSCVIVDKRKSNQIIYNDINIALSKLCS